MDIFPSNAAYEKGSTFTGVLDKICNRCPLQVPKTILQTLEWSGDEDRICLNLRRTAAQLREALSQFTSQHKQTQKLSLALTASACGLLVILLL